MGKSRYPALPAPVEALLVRGPQAASAQWSSSRLRALSGRKLGFLGHYKELLHQYQKAGATKNKVKLELAQPEVAKPQATEDYCLYRVWHK